MIAEAQDSSLEKALIRKVQGFFHHSGDRAVAKSAVEHIQGLSRNGNGPFTLNEPLRFDVKMCLVRPPCDASACESKREGGLQ